MSVMQFRECRFRYNPAKIEAVLSRETRVLLCPLSGEVVQELGQGARLFRGEGEFFGESRYSQMEELRRAFEQGGSGRLFVPLHPPVYAFFTSLRVTGEGGGETLGYRFEFIEDTGRSAPVQQSSAAPAPSFLFGGEGVGL